MELPPRSIYSSRVLIIITIFSASTCSSTNNETDFLSLLSFKSRLSDSNEALASWNNASLHFCRWRGVTCGDRRYADRVTALQLRSLELTGSVSPSLSNLTFLRTLDLSVNDFHGQIPEEIGRLHRLELLNLSFNSISGVVPTNLSRCSGLRRLFLYGNMLEGKIPAELGLLSELQVLNLGRNNLRSSIPSSLSNTSSLIRLLLLENGLVGSIPESLGSLGNLKLFQIFSNQITGEFPSSFLNASSIEIFSAGENQLRGILPANMFDSMPNLQTLLLYENQFYGPLPVSLPRATNLVEIDLQKNGFTGRVPSNLGALKNLYWLNLSFNLLEAAEEDDWSFLTSLTNCSDLRTLALSANLLRGKLPRAVANLSSELEQLSIRFNQISGSIPEGIGNLVSLSGLGLDGNNLSGRIPNTVGKFRSLRILFLSDNSFTGELPSSFNNLTQLVLLQLSANEFSGSIPASIGNFTSLETLDLSNNRFSDAIPIELFNCASLLVLNLSNNLLSGGLPREVGGLKKIYSFDISYNNLSGEVPSTLGDCGSLIYLYLQGNMLQGAIPQSFSKLRGIQELDMSRNKLSGQVPEFLGRISFTFLNLSLNDLDGEVPSEGVFRNSSAVSVVGNSKLCGGPPELHLPACCTQFSKRSRKSNLKIILPSVGFALLLVVSYFVLFALRARNNAKKKNSSTQLIEPEWMKISYTDLFKATDGFSTSNLIGVGSFGSVYKGIIKSDGNLVAVKVLNLQNPLALKSFLAECEIMRHIRHRNLVKILTLCCSTDSKGNDFKALILEFMHNGSLDDWLHPKISLQSELRALSLFQRLNIAIDVATALDYLHHHAHIPIVHCDLKPSNVLLDDEMCAHLGDFGLAKFISLDDCSTSSIGLKGSIGYIAPEYGIGCPVSTQGDVYSFGILLLEMFTGKKPTDAIFKSGVNLHRFVEMSLPDRTLEVADPHLLQWNEQDAKSSFLNNAANLEAEKFLVSVFRIGLSCLNECPKERVDMGFITNELITIKLFFDM